MASSVSKNVTYYDLASDVHLPNLRFDAIVLQTAAESNKALEDFTKLQSAYPKARFVLVLKQPCFQEMNRAYALGIQAFLDYEALQDQIACALKAATSGDLYVCSRVLGRCSRPAAELGGEALLTSREKDVLHLITRGMSNKSIGQALFISPKTVKNHLYSIYKKLGVKDRTNAALVASRSTLPFINGTFGTDQAVQQVDIER